MLSAEPLHCPYCDFPVCAAGIVECPTCGAVLRESEQGCWSPLVHLQGEKRVEDLQRRISRIQQTLQEGPRPRLALSAMPIVLLGALEFALFRLGRWAAMGGQEDALLLVVVAAGLVAFALYMLVDATIERLRMDHGLRRALRKLTRRRNLARRRTSVVYSRLRPAMG
jgi:hypothetical protein